MCRREIAPIYASPVVGAAPHPLQPHRWLVGLCSLAFFELAITRAGELKPGEDAVEPSLELAEVIRLLHGGPVHQMIDLDLQAVEHRAVVLNRNDFSALNPGFLDEAAWRTR
jgi:hypothetical protein